MLMFCFSVEIAYADFLPLPWTYSNAEEYEAGTTGTDSFQGSFSAYLRSVPDKNTAEKGTLRQVKLSPRDWLGKKIKLTVYIKAISVEKGAGAYMQVYSDRGEIISDLMEDRPVRGDSDWKRYVIILDVPYDAAIIHFGVWLKGKGEIRVDNFEFGTAHPDEKMTGKSEKREYGKPDNLDFESKSEGSIPIR